MNKQQPIKFKGQTGRGWSRTIPRGIQRKLHNFNFLTNQPTQLSSRFLDPIPSNFPRETNNSS